MLRYAIVSFVSAYIGAGLFAGLLMGQAIPALNGFGVAVIAVTWPNQIRCARVANGCNPIPEWTHPYIFTFSGEQP